MTETNTSKLGVLIVDATPFAELKKTINSLTTDAFVDFEVLLLIPTDKRTQQLTRLAGSDSRIRLVAAKGSRHERLNIGLKKTTAQCIVHLDPGDQVLHGGFERALSILKTGAVGAVLQSVKEHYASGEPAGRMIVSPDPDELSRIFWLNQRLPNGSLIASKQTILDANGYSDEILKSEDFSLLKRINANSRVIGIPVISLSKRATIDIASPEERALQQKATRTALHESWSQQALSVLPAREIKRLERYYSTLPLHADELKNQLRRNIIERSLLLYQFTNKPTLLQQLARLLAAGSFGRSIALQIISSIRNN